MAMKVPPNTDPIVSELKKIYQSMEPMIERIVAQKAGSESGKKLTHYCHFAKLLLNEYLDMPTDPDVSLSTQYGLFAKKRAVESFEKERSIKDTAQSGRESAAESDRIGPAPR